jgi:hypothetical protein
MTEQQKKRDEETKRQVKVSEQWKAFSTTEAFKDLVNYIDQQREMYRQYAEERQIPHPNGGGKVPIDNETVAALLQNSRGLSIVKAYLEGRIA